MQSTTNYSMNLVEGTDIVNIPVQLNPNFQTIDGAMFDNKQASVGTATEVVTGTAHAIVRNNPDSDIFRFTATGAWTAGDTMSVDGSAVTVHLSDGTAPATGAYIIGAEVVAVINGTLVTLLTSAAQPVAGVTSFNTRTGAVVPQPSDYDASDIDYDNTLSGLTSTDVQSAIDELAGGFGSVSISVAWTNPDISLSFPPQNITLDSDDYDLLIWDFLISGTNHQTTIVSKGASVVMTTALVTTGTYISAIQRNAAYVTDTLYAAADCEQQNTGSAKTTNNNIYKPAVIYRVKF